VIGRLDAKNSFAAVLESEGTISNSAFELAVKKTAIPKNIRHRNPSIEYVDGMRLRFPLVVRSWKAGDSFHPLGMSGKKKLSDFFADCKISNEEKSKIPVVLSGNNIVWVGGLRLDDRFKITEKTKTVYQLKLSNHHGKEEDRRQ
jgi:tRNA(Ile)-lysidine synthase